jgi:cytochrome c oxidase subunit 2
LTAPQSALEPAGQQAEALARLFWQMTAGALVIWLVVMGLALYAAYTPERRDLVGARRLIVIGGVIVPSVVLSALLCYGLALLPEFLAPAPQNSLRILVRGEQYWWRVRYHAPGREPVELANELRLPVNEPVELELESSDVIHSFWVPALAGKVDMIPGRRTRLALLPTRTGTYRGACAEYCGASHAFMAFPVVVQEKAAFEGWLHQQAAPAPRPDDVLARAGQELFLAQGCGACHAVRGTNADGRVGPDLTHVGGRLSLAAGLLDNDRSAFNRWVSQSKAIKPGVHMPAFGMLAPPELAALAAYLDGLE